MEEPTTSEIPGVLRARRFELVDDDGSVRAVLGTHPHPDPDAPPVYGLSLLDRDGRQRVWLELSDTGPALAFDRGGNQLIEVGVNDPGTECEPGGAYLHLNGPNGAPAWSWRVDADGETSLQVRGVAS
jgi:hypothetical protein